MKRSQAVMIAVLLVAAMTLPAHANSYWQGKGRVSLLPATSEWFKGRMDYQPGSAMNRNGAFGRGYNTIYLVDLAPGADYTLGLRYPANSKSKPSVLLFDRWPMDPKAKHYKLPMGPVLLTNLEKIEYRWRLAVSPRSKGRLAFLLVEAKPGFSGPADPFRYFIYLTTPAISPIRQIGEGITYLRGPSDLMLAEPSQTAEYIVEYPYRRTGPDQDHRSGRRSEGNLISNGRFDKGLEGWEVLPGNSATETSGRVAVGNEGLRLWSDDPEARPGVRQTISRYIQDASSLRLTAELKIDSEPSGRFRDNHETPALEITICYQDKRGTEHCGESAYRQVFSTIRNPQQTEQLIKVKEGKWYRFEDELMDLDPRPVVIESIRLAGKGLKGSEAWIESVYLTAR